jgi:TolB-like protein
MRGIVGAAAPVVLGIAVMAFVSCASAPSPAAAGSAGSSKGSAKAKIVAQGRVAIFDFEVKGGDESFASLKSDIPESLSESFVKGKVLTPVERRDLEKAITEQELALSGLVDDATAARVGRLAGARYALLGSASIIGEQMRLSCRLIDIETAEIVYAESVHGDAKKVFKLVDALASEVQEGFSK